MERGQKLGQMVVTVDGEVRDTIPIVASQQVDRLTIPGHLWKDVSAAADGPLTPWVRSSPAAGGLRINSILPAFHLTRPLFCCIIFINIEENFWFLFVLFDHL